MPNNLFFLGKKKNDLGCKFAGVGDFFFARVYGALGRNNLIKDKTYMRQWYLVRRIYKASTKVKVYISQKKHLPYENSDQFC